jgi:oligopeptide/dipeptide ABC transporter ATP-binding protein
MTPLVEARDLVKRFESGGGWLARLLGQTPRAVRALDGVSLGIAAGETLGLIGESGCGKSTLGRLLLRLRKPDGGSVRFDGTELTGLDAAAMKAMRRRMQIVFQNPYASLNPRKTVGQILAQPLRLHGLAAGSARRERVHAMLDQVGLRAGHAGRYPHQFSGGQRQRIAIARALILAPAFVVCDEPVSALDVSIQAQILELLTRLKREFGLTYLFISHDIAVIGHVSDRVAVMYLGAIVESGPARAVLARPLHPYTRALISAVPRTEPAEAGHGRVKLLGDLPSPFDLPAGCRFHPRCIMATELCRITAPELRPIGEDRVVACHHVTP